MCGRYQFTEDQSDELVQIVREIQKKCGVNAWTPGEIRPGAKAPVLVSTAGSVQSELFTWGYQLPKSLVINARSESAADKPLFRSSVASQRCIIPSSGFFEWDSEKRKYFFTLPGRDALYMAGLYTIRAGQPCYCILTTGANESMRDVHPRMPLVLTDDQVKLWLEQPQTAGSILHLTPPRLERSAIDAQIRLW